MSLREKIEEHLRSLPHWGENIEHRGTHLQWEDLRATDRDRRCMRTGLAIDRELAYEWLAETDGARRGPT